MPSKRTSKRRTSRKRHHPKKRVYKRVRRSKAHMTGPFHAYVNSDPFRPQMQVKLHYTETFLMTTGTLGIFGAQQTMLLNSCFDPNETGAGHQPYGFDQLALLYRRYKVNGCLIEMVWTDPSADGMMVGMMMLPPFGIKNIVGLTVDQVKEQPMSVTRSINNSGKQMTIVKQYVPMHSVMGISELQFKSNLTDFSAGMTATPAQSARIRCSVASLRATGGDTIMLRISLTYFTQVYDRVVLNTS